MQTRFISADWPWYKRLFAFAMEDPITIGSQWVDKDEYANPFSVWDEHNICTVTKVLSGWVQFQERGCAPKAWHESVFRHAHRRIK